jgi:drug/metabolite transporter (DMT)-like permease
VAIVEISVPTIGSVSAADPFSVYAQGRRSERLLILAGAALFLCAGLVFVVKFSGVTDTRITSLAIGLALFGTICMALATASFESRQKLAGALAVTQLEERARTEPSEPKLAWDLARLKLESYLDRNLRQVSSIFYLVLLVMTFGMALIGMGVWQAIQKPDSITPAALAALAGVIVQVIGGTFLLVYRSTMAQAKDYVVVLERINAVGMSINILEGVDPSKSDLRDKARVELAQDLLGMYNAAKSKKQRSFRNRQGTPG